MFNSSLFKTPSQFEDRESLFFSPTGTSVFRSAYRGAPLSTPVRFAVRRTFFHQLGVPLALSIQRPPEIPFPPVLADFIGVHD